MLARTHSFISENQLAVTGDRILLGVSGGIDSMVMAFLFLHLPYTTGIGHCNFSLRGEESDKDEELVKEFAAANGIPFRSIKFDTENYARENGISTQMAARDLRYEWFEKVRHEDGYKSIAVAHNLDDHAETMLINLVRGTGPAGLSGMKPLTGRIIRPLLFASREEITVFAANHSVAFREDKTNAEVKYTRNRLRHLVIPVLKDINPSLLNTLRETSHRFSEISSIVENFIENLGSDISETSGDDIFYDLDKLKEFSSNGTVLFGLFRKHGLVNSQLDDLRNIIHGRSGSIVKTSTARIVRDRQKLIVTSLAEFDIQPFTIENENDFFKLKHYAVEIKTVDDSFILPGEKQVNFIDAGKLAFPLTIRKWNNGDYFFPLGMKGRKKLSDYFTDMKFSVVEKEKKLVIESGSQIVCIPGDRTDDRYKITDKTRRIVIIRKATS